MIIATILSTLAFLFCSILAIMFYEDLKASKISRQEKWMRRYTKGRKIKVRGV